MIIIILLFIYIVHYVILCFIVELGIRNINQIHAESTTNDKQLFNTFPTLAEATLNHSMAKNDGGAQDSVACNLSPSALLFAKHSAKEVDSIVPTLGGSIAGISECIPHRQQQSMAVPSSPPPPPPPNITITTSGTDDNTSIDGMLDRISHDLDYLLNRITEIPVQMRHCPDDGNGSNSSSCSSSGDAKTNVVPTSSNDASISSPSSSMSSSMTTSVPAAIIPQSSSATAHGNLRDTILPPIAEESSTQLYNDNVQI